MRERTKKRLGYVLRTTAFLSILLIVCTTVQLLLSNYHAAQLTAQGIPDLRDTTHTDYWIAVAALSLTGLLCLAGTWLLDRKRPKKARSVEQRDRS